MKPAIFVLDPLTPGGDYLIRLVVPYIDEGHAIYLETTFKRNSKEQVEYIAEQIACALTQTVFFLDPLDALGSEDQNP